MNRKSSIFKMLVPSLLLLGFVLFAAVRCGVQGVGNNSTCNASHVGNGVTISLTQIGGNSYRMKLCSDLNSGTVYSVFGGSTSGSIDPSQINTSAQIRKPHVSGATASGNLVQIDFNSSDIYFVVYADDMAGNYSTTTNLVSGRITGR